LMSQSIIRRDAKLLKPLRFGKMPEVVCALLPLSPAARGEGVLTDTITGIVQSSDGLSLPGVSWSRQHRPSLQGRRTDVTDVNGRRLLRMALGIRF
jgi:hypothetical protein